MVERREHLRLAAESRQSIGIVGDDVRDDLERDVAVELVVPGAVDLAHASAADELEDLVGAKTRARCQLHDRAPAWARMSSFVLAGTPPRSLALGRFGPRAGRGRSCRRCR